MKALLINPPAKFTVVANNPSFIDEERGFNPPLGILYIAGYLRAHSDRHSVEVIDCQVEELDYDGVRARIAASGADVIGISAMTFTILDVMETLRIAKQVNPEAKIVLGGPHVHIYQRETIQLSGVDFVVLGEGEQCFLELLDALEDKKDLRKVPGLMYRDGKDIVTTGHRELIENLDELAYPARDLTPYQKYNSVMARQSPITTMFTSRGCPYKCTFCDRPNLGKDFRANSPNYVVDEMETIVRMGIKEALIYDDTYTVNKKRVADVCDEIMRRGLKLRWDVRARVNSVDEPLLKKMKAAGCDRIHYGVEAGTDRMLQVLKKGTTIEQVTRAFKMTKDAGIDTLGYFMIGSPTETREEILETIRYARKIAADYVHITILTPFPATEVYFDGLRHGVIKKDFWREFAKNPTPDFEPEYWEENLRKEELFTLLEYAYKSFYTRPGYVMKALLRVRSFPELIRKAHAGIKIWQMNANGARSLNEI